MCVEPHFRGLKSSLIFVIHNYFVIDNYFVILKSPVLYYKLLQGNFVTFIWDFFVIHEKFGTFHKEHSE